MNWDRTTVFFVIFVLGGLVSYGFFTYVQQSDRRVSVDTQLFEVEDRLVQVDTIYANCISLQRARENAPLEVRDKCVESRDFVVWARSFPADSKLRTLKIELLVLADAVEEMTEAIAIHNNSQFAREVLLTIPGLITTIRQEISRVRQRLVL